MAEQAVALHQQGRLAEAELLYRECLAREPELFGPHYYLGVLRMQQSRFEEAVASLRQARRLRGGPTRTLRILAQLASELRR